MIFLGIKYEPLSDSPPVIKICEWGPWGTGPGILPLSALSGIITQLEVGQGSVITSSSSVNVI